MMPPVRLKPKIPLWFVEFLYQNNFRRLDGRKLSLPKPIRRYFTPFTETTFQGRNQQEDEGFRKIKLKA